MNIYTIKNFGHWNHMHQKLSDAVKNIDDVFLNKDFIHFDDKICVVSLRHFNDKNEIYRISAEIDGKQYDIQDDYEDDYDTVENWTCDHLNDFLSKVNPKLLVNIGGNSYYHILKHIDKSLKTKYANNKTLKEILNDDCQAFNGSFIKLNNIWFYCYSS